jgi:hypothetical protein
MLAKTSVAQPEPKQLELYKFDSMRTETIHLLQVPECVIKMYQELIVVDTVNIC